MYFEVLVEGGADVPAVKSVFERKFGFEEGQGFRIHPHKGKGRLPTNPSQRPDIKHRGLLDQLPAKLRGMSWMGDDYCLVVLVDADDENCVELKQSLLDLYENLHKKPKNVLFRIAVEEVESWFIADTAAVKKAYPSADVNKLRGIAPDSVIGAWERLAESLGKKPNQCRGADKHEWAESISPYLDLDTPSSPSLKAFVTGISRCVGEHYV